MGRNLILFVFLGMFLLCSCASFPAEKECPAPGEIQFTVNVGFEVEHESCDGLQAISWLVSIAIYDDECEPLPTNLVTFWDGCRYRLYQTDSPDDWVYVGSFKDLGTLGEFIKAARPFASTRQIGR